MRKTVGYVLAFAGAFLLVAGLLAQFYAPDRLEKTPLNVDSVTLLSGEAELADGTGGTTSFPVLAYSTTYADSEISTDQVILFQNSSCLVRDLGGIDGCVDSTDSQDRLLSAGTDTFATDRVTALAVNDPDILPASAVAKDGLINKWPFDAQKITYPYWDDTAGKAVDAVFDREDTVNGLPIYAYKTSVSGVPIELAEGVPGVYNDEKEIWIDPVTGSIINQVEHQERIDADGNPFLIVDLAFTDEQIAANVEDAKANGGKLSLVTQTLPRLGYFVGIPLLLIGHLLLVLAHRSREDWDDDDFSGSVSLRKAN